MTLLIMNVFPRGSVYIFKANRRKEYNTHDALYISFLVYHNERKSEQAHIPHAPTLLENAVYNEWQFQALGTGNRTKKGISIASQKDRISISCINAYLHIMSFIITKFHAILLRGFSGVVLTNCFSSIFHFRQISKFKKGVNPRKKMESKFPVDMHIYTLCPS